MRSSSRLYQFSETVRSAGGIGGVVTASLLQAIANIDQALSALGASMSDAVRVQISLIDLDYQDELLKAFAARFAGIDTILTIICQPFVGDVKMEVEIVAYRAPGGNSGQTIRMPTPSVPG